MPTLTKKRKNIVALTEKQKKIGIGAIIAAAVAAGFFLWKHFKPSPEPPPPPPPPPPGIAQLRGIVTDAETGKGIVDIRVTCSSEQHGIGPYSSTTRSDGSYYITNISPNAYNISFFDPSERYKSQEIMDIILEAGITELNVELIPAEADIVITEIIVPSKAIVGTPINFGVHVKNEGEATGTRTINCYVNEVFHDSVTFTLKRQSWTEVWFKRKYTPTKIGIYTVSINGWSADFEAIISTVPMIQMGRVTDWTTGLPIAGARLTAYYKGSTSPWIGYSDENGNYELFIDQLPPLPGVSNSTLYCWCLSPGYFEQLIWQYFAAVRVSDFALEPLTAQWTHAICEPLPIEKIWDLADWEPEHPLIANTTEISNLRIYGVREFTYFDVIKLWALKFSFDATTIDPWRISSTSKHGALGWSYHLIREEDLAGVNQKYPLPGYINYDIQDTWLWSGFMRTGGVCALSDNPTSTHYIAPGNYILIVVIGASLPASYDLSLRHIYQLMKITVL